jgi:hypothetical protein
MPITMLQPFCRLSMPPTSTIPAEISASFESLCIARNAIRTFIVDRGESFIVSHSDRMRYIVTCKDEFCLFDIRVSVLKGPIIQVTRYTPHSCSPITHRNFRLGHSVSFLTSRHRAAVVDDREIRPAQIQSIERIYHGNTGVSYMQAWRTREALRQELEGDEAECFKRLPGLMSALDSNNEENRGHVETWEGHFKRCYIAPAATRAAFEACRPFVALDGCHTKSRFRMTLLVTCTLDGNNEILPLTWALVPIEDGDNWTWFLLKLKHHFWGMDCNGIVIISDRDKGLQTAVPEVFPNAHHSYCCQHLADNVQKYFGLACRTAF